MPEPRLPRSASPRPRKVDWVVLRTAPDQLTAEIWRGQLEAEDIPAMLAPGDVVSFLGVSAAPCRLLVPDGLLAAAELVLDGELWSTDAAE
jgi:hypothetical protein